MTTEVFYVLWQNTALRQRLLDFVKSKTRDVELQRDCYQSAWAAIGAEPDEDRAVEYYARVGERAIDAERQRWQRPVRRRYYVVRREPTDRLEVRLPRSLIRRLQDFCAVRGITMSAVVRRAIESAVQDRVPIDYQREGVE